MININKILLDKEQCLGHTGLEPEAFAYLLPSFEIEYRLHAEEKYREEHGKDRERAWGGGRSGKLDTMERKMFFVLYWLKTYPTYEVLGGAFDMKRSRAFEWIENTLPPLLSALKKTVWFLQQQKKSWIESWLAIQKSKKFLLMELKDQYKEAHDMKSKKKITPEKRKDTQRKTSS